MQNTKNKSKQITRLNLKNYHNIRTPFAFFDETGSLNDQKGGFRNYSFNIFEYKNIKNNIKNGPSS